MFSVAMVQLCRQLALPFWGQVFSCHGSTLSSTRVAFLGPGFQLPWFNFVANSRCLFGARFSVAMVQLCRRIALPFWNSCRIAEIPVPPVSTTDLGTNRIVPRNLLEKDRFYVTHYLESLVYLLK
jgi:hypothetical protein